MRAVDPVVERFSSQTPLVRRLYLSDARFRGLCEDFALSISSLHRFEARSDAHLRAEIDDYRVLIKELEIELRNYLNLAENR
jgi:hypothetical protein